MDRTPHSYNAVARSIAAASCRRSYQACRVGRLQSSARFRPGESQDMPRAGVASVAGTSHRLLVGGGADRCGGNQVQADCRVQPDPRTAYRPPATRNDRSIRRPHPKRSVLHAPESKAASSLLASNVPTVPRQAWTVPWTSPRGTPRSRAACFAPPAEDASASQHRVPSRYPRSPRSQK